MKKSVKENLLDLQNDLVLQTISEFHNFNLVVLKNAITLDTLPDSLAS
jgi:hypothetical protein